MHQVAGLRIVDDQLFEKVQALQLADTPLRVAIRKGIRMSPNKGKGNYWLSGILVCDLCGSNLQVNGSMSYICPTHNSGDCKNDLRFKRADIEAAKLEILRDELLRPESIKAEMRRIEGLLKDQEREERAAMRQASGDSELRRIESKIASVRKLNLGSAAELAAIRELESEREALTARAARKQSPALREARQMLAQLPRIAVTFDKQLEATLIGRAATKDEMPSRRPRAS